MSAKDEARKGEGYVPSKSLITDHPYAPRRPERADWDLCLVCNLSVAAHARRASVFEENEMRQPQPALAVQHYGTAYSFGHSPTLPGTVEMSRDHAEAVFGRAVTDALRPPGLLRRLRRRLGG